MKKIIIFIFILAVLIIGYHYFIALPQQQEARAKAWLVNCLNQAAITNNENWSSNCQQNAIKIEDGYNNCVSNSGLGYSFCLNSWGKPDSSPTCSLPTALADEIHKQGERAKNDCYNFYNAMVK